MLFAGILVIQLPQVQTYVAGKVVDRLDDKLDGDIHFEKIHLKPFTTLVLKKVAIIDRNPQKCAVDPLAEPVDTFSVLTISLPNSPFRDCSSMIACILTRRT